MQLHTKNGEESKKCFLKKLWCNDKGGVQNEGSVLFADTRLMNYHSDPKNDWKVDFLGVTCIVSKCLSPQQALLLHLFSALVRNIFCCFWNHFHFSSCYEEEKTGNGLIQERAMKRNGIETGLTSQTTLRRC